MFSYIHIYMLGFAAAIFELQNQFVINNNDFVRTRADIDY